MPNKKKLFDALLKEGYDNFDSESSFNAYIDNADNRKKLFNALKEEGYDNFSDEKAFDEYLGYGSDSQLKQETYETRKIGNTITGGVGTQEEADSIFEANAKAVREKYANEASQPEQGTEIQENEIKRLQGIRDTAQKQINEAGFFDRFFDADTRVAVATRNQAEEALETYEEAKHANEGWFDRNVMGVLRGIADKATDLSTWDFGISGIASATALNDAYKKWEKGEQLTLAEQNMLDAYGLATAVQAAYQDKVGMAYKVGGSLPESAAFSASFILNPAAGAGKKIAEATAKAAVKKYGTSLVSKLAKGAARVGGDVAEMAVATGIPGGFRVAEDYYNRLNGQTTFDIDENGIVRYGGQLEQEKADDAIWKAFGSQFIENYSEAMGNYFAPMGTMLSNLTSKGLKAGGLGKLADAVSDISSSQFSKGLQRFKEATKFDGLVGEYLEEVAGNVINAATVGDMNFNSPEDPRSVFNPETNIETFLSCALMSGTMYAVEAPVSIYNRNVAKRNLNNADTEASKLWGDRWNDMRSQMDEADPQLLAQLLTGVQNATDLSEEQKSAAMEYGKRLMQYQGYNARRVQNQMESTDEANEINNAYDEGAEMQNPSDKHNAKLAADRAEAALGGSSENADEQQFVQMVMAGSSNPVQTINSMAEQGYSDEQIQKAKDYYTAMHRMNGMTDAVIDRVNETIERVNAEVDANTNRDNGSVTQVILRDGSFGYVVQGTVVAGEENSVDVNNSDDTIMVRLQNGEVKMMNPNKDLSVVKWMQSPEALKEENNTILRRQLIDKEIGEIDWNPATPNPKVGDSFEMDGVPVTIVSHDGNGGMFVVPSEQWQAAQGNEKQMQQLVMQAQQKGVVPESEFKNWASAQIDLHEEAVVAQQEAAIAESEVVEMQPAEEQVANEEPNVIQEPQKTTLEDVVSSLPKTKKGEIDYVALTPQQQYQYTSITESPEVALEDLKADIEASNEEINKVQEQLSKAKGGKRAQLRDKVRQLTAANEELQSFYNSVLPEAPIQPEEDNIELIVLEEGPKNPEKKRVKKPIPEGEEPMNAIEFVAQQFAVGNIKLVRQSVTDELHYGNEELGKFIRLWAKPENGGVSVERAGEILMEMDREEDSRFFDHTDANAGRNAILELFGMAQTWGDIANLVKNNRAIEEKRRIEAEMAEYESWVQENFHMSAEEYQAYEEVIEQYLAERGLTEADYQEFMSTFVDETINNVQDEQQGTIDQGKGSGKILYGTQSLPSGRDSGTAEGSTEADGGIVGENGSVLEGASGSEVTDENGNPFVVAPNGTINFGYISSETGLSEAPIRLVDETRNYGKLHIEQNHGDQIRNAGFNSVEEFVEFVASNYNTIKLGNTYFDKSTYIVELTDKKNNTLFVELSSDGSYWNVNSAGVFRKGYSKNKEVIWTAPAVGHNSTTENKEVASSITGEIGSTGSTSENSSHIPSDNKDNNLPENNKENQEIVASQIEKAREEVDKNPSEAQKEAGNYKKGHVKIDGYDITIENPKGGTRSGTDKNGKEWSITMNNDYGYIRGTEAVDGDHIDVFLSDNPTEGNVFVVDQTNENGTFDESKVMYGFSSLEEARSAYLSNYEKGWESRIMAITEVSKDEFKKWIDSSHRKTKAFSEYKSVKSEEKIYTIEPAQYTTKKGKVLDMFLVKPTKDEMSREKQTNARILAKDMRGWYDRNTGGWMLRSKEDAQKFADEVFAVSHSDSYDLITMKDVTDGNLSFSKPVKEDEYSPVWQYVVSVDKETGFTTLRRDDVSSVIPVGDARFTIQATSPQEMLDILRNPLNGLQQALEAVEVTLENRVKTMEMDKSKKSVNLPKEGEIYKNNMAGGDAVALIRGVGKTDYVVAFASDLEDARGGLFMGDKIVSFEEMDKWLADGSLTKIEKKKEYHGGERVFSLKHNTNKDILTAHHTDGKVEYTFTDGTKANQDEVNDALPLAESKKETNPSGNKLVSDERYAELRERMKQKLRGQMNIGVDPEILAIGTEMAVYHIEKGARKFVDYAKAMIEDLGDAIRPYLKSFYNGARDLPEVQQEGLASEMTPYEEVSGFDVTNFDKQSVNVIETAENIAKESVVEEQVEIAKERVKKQRKASEKAKKEVSLLGDLFNQNIEDNETGTKEQRRNSSPKRDSDADREVGIQAREESAGSSVRREAGSLSGNNVSDKKGSGRVHGVSGQQAIKNNANNFSFGENHIELPSGEIAKLKANIEAIRTLKEIEASGQPTTDTQKEVLSKYVGWGGLSAALDEQKFLNSKGWLSDRNWNEKYLPYYVELREILTPEEFNDAVQSTNTSHYTPEEIIRGMWNVVEKSGFKGGRISEPAAGVGHILGFMPKEISERSQISGTELDSISGRITKALYPDANIKVQGYEQEFAPQSKDLVITNVPFGKTAPYDKALDKALRKKLGSAYNLHNYFIAKGLLELKPNGLGVFVTSSATMDGANSKFREWVAANGIDLIGAIRLPNDAFLKNAGTSVTADMLVFRKRKSGESSNGVDFVSTTQVGEGNYVENGETHTKPIMVNEYFANHPEMMLGEMMTAHDAGSGGLYSGASQTCVAKKGSDLSKELQNAILRLDAIDSNLSESQNSIATEGQAQTTELKNGTLVVEGDNVFIAMNGELQPIAIKKEFTFNGKKQKTAHAVRDYIELKETLKSLISAEQSSTENPEPIRKKLNKEYDAFVAKYGTLNRNKALDDVFAEDFEHNLPLSLETVKRVPSATGKSMVWEVSKGKGILDKRVSYPVEEPTKADNIQDAINISRSYKGVIDVPYIAELVGKDELDVITEILQEGLAYRDPITNNLVDKDTYLSGNVREKLEQARTMAESYPEEYQKNVDDLAKVQPETVRFGDISYRIGTPWIPTQYVDEFAEEVLGISGFNVQYTPTINEFVVSNSARISDFAKSGQFRTDRVGVIDLLEYALNQRKPKIFDKRVSYGPLGKTEEKIPNEAETQAAAEKIMEISDKFIDYIDGRKEIHRELERIYNDKYNNYRLKEYELPSFEHYPNSNAEITLRSHQSKAVQRCLSESTLLAHQVGTGKTFTMITAAMEMRRLGIANKPMIVVQNATLEDFVKDFYTLYPGANVLAPGKDERSAENRKRLFNLIATGDFDAIVIPQSFMQFIPDDEGRKKELIQKRIDEYEQAIANIEDYSLQRRMQKEIDALRDSLEGREKGKKRSVKDKAKAADRIKAKMERQLDRRTDDVLTFEQMGIDALFIDEAHNFKKIGFASKMNNVKGIDTSASQRANSLLLKAQYVQEKNGGRNVILATGTPITNTMAEVWTMMKFVSPEILDTYNIQSFDDFATTFGVVEPSLEFTATGNFKIADRFKSYVNVPELVKAFRSHADVVLTSDVKEFKEDNRIPKLKDDQMTNVVIDKNEDLEDVMDILIKRLEAYNEMSGEEKRKWSALPLVVFSRAKQAAIDLRLLNPSYEDNPNSKTNHVVRNVLKLYKESTPEKGAQMIFCDSYQSPGEQPKMDIFDYDPDVPRFNLYEDIKKKLVEGGIPSNEIAVVNNYDGERRKQLFEKVRNGDVRVLLGSTEKMGVGVNVQDRMFALHHIDAPIRPMDFEQRNGRILRQGNLYATWGKPVNVVTYGVQGTLDATAYDRLRIKQDFINQMMKGDVSGRVMEEQDEEDPSGMTFNQMAATLSGDKTAQLLFVAENKLKKLRNLKRSDANSKSGMAETIQMEVQRLKGLQSKAEMWESANETVKKHFPEGIANIKVNGKNYTEKFGPALDPIVEEFEEQYSLNRGIAPLKMSLNDGNAEVVVHFDEGKMVYELYAGKEHIVESRQISGGKGLVSSIEHQIKATEKNLNDSKARIIETKNKISGLEKAMNTPWGKEEELREAEKQVADLKKKLEEQAIENSKKKPVEQPREETLERQGEGFLSADEVSMANDPIGKMFGKSTRTANERKSFAERERKRMVDRVNSLSKKLGLNNVEIVMDPSTLTGAQRKAKGFYSMSKGKITIVIPNHSSAFDAEQTLLHEAVAHYGLRKLFGAQFGVFINNVYRNASPEVRERINQMAMKNGWDFAKATEEYLASLAENTNFENLNESWWNKIKQLFLDMLHQIGFEGFTGVTLTDNELRYILWRSYENLAEPGRYRSILGEAADIVMQDNLKVGNYAEFEDISLNAAEYSEYTYTPEDVIEEFEEIVANHPDFYAVRTEADIDALPTDRYTKRDLKEKLKNPRISGTNIGNDMIVLFVDRMDEEELRNTIPHELAHFASRSIKIEDIYKASALAYMQKHYPEKYKEITGDYSKEKWGEEAVGYLFEEKSKELGFERILNAKFVPNSDIDYIFYHITNFLNHGRKRNNPLRYGERSSSQRTNDGERKGLLQKTGILGNGERQVQRKTEGSVSSNDRPGNDRELGTASGTSMGMGYESRSQEEVEDDNLYRTTVDIEGMADNTARKLYEDSIKSKAYRFQEGFQDSMLALKKLQEAIVKQHSGKLEEWEDAYTAENQMSSRDTSEIENYTFNHFNPMMEQVKLFLEKSGLDYEGLRKYMFAKSGLERNRDFAVRDAIAQQKKDGVDVSGIYEAYMQRKQDLLLDLKSGVINFRQYCEEMDNEAIIIAPDILGRDYSGISSLFDPDNFTEEALKYVESVEQSAGSIRSEYLWESIKESNQFTLDRAKQSGVMSTDNHKKVSEMFEWYIPMRGWSDTKARDVYDYFGSQEGIFNPTAKTAYGRKSLADDPLATMANMAESAIFQGNKNQMKQKLLNLAFDKPTNLITVMDSWIENKGTEQDPKWEYVYPDISQDDDADVVAFKISQFEAEMSQKADQGLAKKVRGKADIPYIATPKEVSEHIIRVKRNGREFVMIINGNPRAAQAINGMTNPETYNGIIERVSRRLNQFMAAAFTAKNPTFIMRNLSRDLIFTNTAVAVKEDVKYGRRFRNNQFKVIGNMRGLMKRYQSGKLDMSNELDKMFMEFIKNGGETGFAQLTSVDEYKKKIQRELKDAKNGGVVSNGKKAGRLLMDTIEFYNRCAEDVSRFTVYMTSRQEGRSIQRSVSDAKEITVNFNKRGSGSKAGGFIGFGAQSMRSLYLFFNAAVQALVNFKRLGQKHPIAFTTALSTYAASGFLMPVVNEFLSSILGGDDDDYENLPEWVRRNNLVISLGKWGGDAMFFTIPLPVEMRAFYGLGETANQVLAGNVRGKDAAWQIAGQFAEMLPLNFVTDAAGPWNAFTPDAFKPIVQAYITNKDWTGKPIYRDNGFNKESPEWTKAYAGTSKWLVNSAELINEFTGGDKYKTGLIDPNPARLEHLFTGYLGGFGDMFLGAGKTLSMLWDEDYRNVRNVPVIKAFFNQSDERTSYSQVKKDYASFKDEYEETVRRINGYKKEMKRPQTALEYAERTQFLNESIQMRRYDVMRKYEKQLSKLYKQMKENPDPEIQKSINVTINQIKANAVKALRSIE